ncbi:polymorphic toxin-type HINT domain-containing protein [Leptospira bandrabouensis]|nr:polymorphic toxin-type HINT domain-containing protein [Leptospira bandrabouensis]MCG6146462.1 Hint domain-containing protein [Leptospira bandrabouensis]MCG6161609.1 Hint domain-containing protein [Leptospira bandrabouensis]MCG6166049.1 Hint domain-containing protein [Leptospira bandrabouensis]
MEDRSKQMAVLQTLDSLWSLPLTFEATIAEQNKALDEQLTMQLLQDSFIKMGPTYVRSAVDKMGNPSYQILPAYAAFVYIKPDKLPTVKDSNGKEWDLTDYQALQGKGGPASAELNMMVRLARNQMQTDFKQTFDPEKSENREIAVTMFDPKAMARVARAAQSALGQLASDPQKMFEFNSADAKGKEAMIESAKNSGYLVGPTVGGTFGTHHFNQFYPILKMKEKYNEIKAEGEALNGNGFANAVGGVVSVATGGIINAKTAAKFMNDNGDVIDTITTVAAVIAAPFTGGTSLLALAAYKAVKGAYEGGVLGAVTGAASAYSSITGVDVSYSYDEGFGANVGVKMGAVSLGVSYSESAGFGASASVKLGGLSAGVSYTQNGGFGANVGYEFGGKSDMLKGLGVNLSYSQSGGFGGGVSYSKTTEGGTKVTGGLNYSKDAGVGASLNAQREVSRNDNYATTVTGGLSYSQKQGFGASVDATIEKVAKETPPGTTPPKPKFQSVSQLDMGLSFNQKEGFSASVGFDGINALSYNQNTGLSGNTNFAMDFRKKQIQDEIDEETKAKKEAADKKLEAAKQEWLKEKRKDPNYANIKDDDALLAQYKKEQEAKAEKDGSRDNILEKIGGDIYDDVAGALGISTSDAGRLDKDGKFVPRTCFVAGTKVHTKEGLKNIEDIRVGDVVLSKSDETGEVSYRKVVETFIRQTEAIYIVSFADGTVLETTWNHPFRVKKQGHALEKFSIETTDWVQAKDLHPGDVALRADGKELVITDITIDEREETVYNFEVEKYHTYFVGEIGVWVHNADYKNLSMGYRELVLFYTQNGKDYQGNYHEVGQKNDAGYRTFQDKETNSMLIMDKDGNTTRYYKDRYGNNIEEEFSFKDNTLTDREKMRINGREMSDGSIVRINKKGMMTVMTQEEMAGVKNATAFVNGMKMKHESATDAAQFVREKVKMQGDLYLYNNGTQGPVVDVVKVAMGQNSQKQTGYEKAQDKLRDSLASGQITTVYSYSQGSVIAGNAFQQAAKKSGSKNFYDNKKWVSLGGGHVSQNIPKGLKNATFYTNTADMISNGAPLLSDIMENVSNGTPSSPPRNLVKRFITERQEGRNGSYNSACVSANPIACHSIYSYDWALSAEGNRK